MSLVVLAYVRLYWAANYFPTGDTVQGCDLHGVDGTRFTTC